MPTLEYEYDALDGLVTLELDIEYTVSPIRRAVISGPAERCHPEEGGIEIKDVRVGKITLYDAVGDEYAMFTGAAVERLSDDIVKALGEPDAYWVDLVADHLNEQDEDTRADYEYHAGKEAEEGRANKPR